MFEFVFVGKAKDLSRAIKLAIALEGKYQSKFRVLPRLEPEDFYLDEREPRDDGE